MLTGLGSGTVQMRDSSMAEHSLSPCEDPGSTPGPGLIKRFITRFTILRCLFYRDIKPGDVFVFNDFEKNPFKGGQHRVRVKAVKNGFVNYEFIGSSIYTNESGSIPSFNFCYYPDFDTSN